MVSGLSPAPALAAGPSLSERLERKDFSKPVFNKARPGPQEYPEWLEGTWNATTSFEGGGRGKVSGTSWCQLGGVRKGKGQRGGKQ